MLRISKPLARRLRAQLPIDPDLATPKPQGRRPPFGLVNVSLVGLGGAVGTLARYECQLRWPDAGSHFPLTIFLVNITGALLLGVILSALVRLDLMGGPRLFACVGVLGGWTTMSTLAVKIDTLISSHHFGLGLAYAFTSLVAGGVAAAIGMWMTHRLLKERSA